MSENAPNLIQFLAAEPAISAQPTPAAQWIPQWLKQLPPVVMCTKTDPPGPTPSAKQCMPFLEAMTSGYAIPINGDVRFHMRSKNQLDFEQSEDLMGTQDEAQYAGAPFDGQLIVKFRSPWIIQTPPGYSTLFVPLLNQFNMPFHILAGLVETDKYYAPIFFPSVCLMQPGQEFEIRKGTPLVQAIPMRRESWISECRAWDRGRFDKEVAGMIENRHLYKEQYWEKKTFR